MAKNKFAILITDRNRHVREYIKRELINEGYEVYLAKNGDEVKNLIYSPIPLDLLILDPELPSISDRELYKEIQDRVPPLPIIIHAFADFEFPKNLEQILIFQVEKKSGSIEPLKKAIQDIFQKNQERTRAALIDYASLNPENGHE